jgi:7-carboxy-7-deazaguanine synthase
MFGIDVLFQKLARRRLAVDVEFADLDAGTVQKTSGVSAGSSGGLPVEARFGHACRIIDCLMPLTINEIFYSIQGESTRAGHPCVFVRLTACDLRCTWCDTPYAFFEGRKLSVAEVIEAVERYDCRLVEITGGEPLLQEDVYELMQRLLAGGRTVLLETGGHQPIDRVPADVVKIMDIKCPGSGEVEKNHWVNLDRLSPHDEVKFVMRDRADYEFARETIRRRDLSSRCGAVLLSPVHDVLDPKDLAEWILADGLPVRLQLQLHKYIWSPTTRGV